MHELYCCQVEIATPVCETLDDVRQALARARGAVATAAEQNGVAISAAGTHPFSEWEDQVITPNDRYYTLQDDLQQLV